MSKSKLTIGQKSWDKASIKELLKSSEPALLRAILLIYEQQTYDEKAAHTTNKINGVGFNAYDAEFLTSCAKKLTNGTQLTTGQLVEARNRMLKYAGQLLTISIEKQQKGVKHAA